VSEQSAVSGSTGLPRSTLLALVAMGVAVLVIANDFTSLSVALPAIESDLDSDLTTVQWVINAYALVFGILIVPGGRLADMFGRRRMFVVGAMVFAAFSFLGGLAPGIGWLVAWRALMGIGGALMWPAVLGMTFAILPEEKAGLAGGLVLGAAGFGNAVGPLIGGGLTDTIGWRWIFFLNVPIAALAITITMRTVHLTQERTSDRRIDVTGIVVLTIGWSRSTRAPARGGRARSSWGCSRSARSRWPSSSWSSVARATAPWCRPT
jgi:MFS family permease